MTSTTRATTPLMSNYFNYEFDFQPPSFPAPTPTPANGPSLLDDNETGALADFFDKVGSGVNLENFLFDSKSPFFDPKLPDPMMWGWHGDTSERYPFQPEEEVGDGHGLPPATPTAHYHPSSTSEMRHMSLAATSNPPVAESVAPSEITINPFEGGELLLDRTKADSVVSAEPLAWGSDPHFKGAGSYSNPNVQNPPMSTEEDVNTRIGALVEKTRGVVENTLNGSPGKATATGSSDETEGSSRSSDRTPSPTHPAKNRRKSDNESSRKMSASPTKSSLKKVKHRKSDASPKIKKKPPTQKKENLTEAQKRENHIQSEQKRRNLIRQGFDDLCALVPELRGGGYSKSAVLIHAATFLENLEEGNKMLRMQIKELEAC